MAVLQVLGTDKALRLNDFNLLNLVESFDWAPNFNAQDVFEMGTTTKIDTAMELETSGSFTLSSVGNTAGLLARMKVDRDGSGNFQGYLYDSGGASGKNGYTLTQDDLAEMKFDLIMHEKTDQKTFNRSVYLPCAYLTSMSGRVGVDGMASETFNFAGSFVTGFPSPYHDIRSVPATRTTATTCTLEDTSVASATWTLAFLFVDGVPITNINTEATYATLGAGGVVTVTTSEGFQIPAGAHLQACVYRTTPSTTFPTTTAAQRFQDVAAGNVPISYVKGYQANVYLAPVASGAPVSAEKWLRVQSIDWNIDLRVDTLRQVNLNLQGSSIYARVPTYPLSVSANISVTESDWADWKSVLTKSFTGGQVHSHTYDWSPENLKQQFAIVIDYFTKGGTRIQNWRFLDMRVDGYGSRQAVGGRGEVSWSLRGTEFRLQGFNT